MFGQLGKVAATGAGLVAAEKAGELIAPRLPVLGGKGAPLVVLALGLLGATKGRGLIRSASVGVAANGAIHLLSSFGAGSASLYDFGAY